MTTQFQVEPDVVARVHRSRNRLIRSWRHRCEQFRARARARKLSPGRNEKTFLLGFLSRSQCLIFLIARARNFARARRKKLPAACGNSVSIPPHKALSKLRSSASGRNERRENVRQFPFREIRAGRWREGIIIGQISMRNCRYFKSIVNFEWQLYSTSPAC